MATALTQTTLSAATTTQSNVLTVASATGITAPSSNFMQQLYVINLGQKVGELMNVVAVNGTQITVSRLDEFRQHFVTSSVVIIAPLVSPAVGPSLFATDPYGYPLVNPALYTPWINVTNGNQWLYSSVLLGWVPGWQNTTAPAAVTTAVASAAGTVTPSGPLFHITGTSAITGFTLPVGFTGGSFTVIPDAVFTWTAAGNIALAGTAVVSKALTFTYEQNAAKPFFPSYIA